jgi:hypothetical protein
MALKSGSRVCSTGLGIRLLCVSLIAFSISSIGGKAAFSQTGERSGSDLYHACQADVRLMSTTTPGRFITRQTKR